MPKWPCAAALTSWLELPLAAGAVLGGGLRKGAVQTLHALGCGTVSFGAETADTDLLLQAAELLNSLPMKGESGSPHLSYAARRQEELSKINKQAAVLLDNPNNTLAVEYCRFLLPLGMRPLAVLRQGAAHDARAPHSGFASASLLRAHLRDGDFAFCAPFLPPAARAVWKKAADCGEAPVTLPEDTLLALLRTALYQGRLRTGSADGFDERLRKAVYTAHSFSDAVEKARTRRFPAARVQPCAPAVCARCGDGRTCLPAYLRVLALGVRGRAAIRQAACRYRQTGNGKTAFRRSTARFAPRHVRG